MIKDIIDNQTIEDVFLVKDVRRNETRNGKPFLALNVIDSSGEISGRVWENADRYLEECQPGTTILLKGQAQSYKGVLQLRVDHLEKHEVSADELARFIPTTKGDIKSMAAEMIDLAKSITDSHLHDLTLSFLQDSKMSSLFTKAPAAKQMHHACLGGLLEHTLGVTRLADAVASLYPAVDRSLLLAGAILHDLGKLVEFSYESFPYDYSDRGRLVGHMVLGIEMIQEKIAGQPDFPEETGNRLKHLILAHHGRHEFGSPVLPMMLEAFILHFIDDLDAKVDYITGLANKAKDPGYQWSEYQRNLERFLYVRGADADGAEPEEDPAEEIDTRQTNLWR